MISQFRRISIATIVICIATLLPVPTHSFGSLPKAASLGRHSRNLSRLPNLLSETNAGGSSFTGFAPTNKPSGATVLFNNNNKKKKDNEGGEADNDEGLFAEKNIPGLVFTTILTLWHFWIGPALRPIILDMQQ